MDKYLDHRIDITIPSFKEHVVLAKGSSELPWWYGSGFFYLAMLLGMSWPYRLMFRGASGKAEYNVSKKIFLQSMESSHL